MHFKQSFWLHIYTSYARLCKISGFVDVSIPVPFNLVEIFDLSLYTAGIP